MPAGTLLTVLSNIPWGQVVDNAPKLADGAVKLWGSVTQRKKVPAALQDGEAGAAERLENRVAALEDSVAGLQEQMLASSALVKDLAEQNRLLVERVKELADQNSLLAERLAALRSAAKRWGLAGAAALLAMALALLLQRF